MVKNYMRKLLYFDNQWHVHCKQSSCLPLVLVLDGIMVYYTFPIRVHRLQICAVGEDQW